MKRSLFVQWMSVLGVCLAGRTIVVLAAPPAQVSERQAEGPPAMSAADLYRPTLMPDRIVLTWTGDPATTQTVTWRTSVDVTRALAEVAVAQPGPQSSKDAVQVEAVTRLFECDSRKWHVHCAPFKDLSPAMLYAYRVGDGTNWSEWFHFRTAPVSPESFSFIYFGDSQIDHRSKWSRVIRQAFADAPRAAFTLHAGDLATQAENDTLWAEWFAAGGWMNAMVPVIATPGNHDYASRKNPDGTRERWLSRYWNAQFAFPANGPPELQGTAYYVDYQNLRVVTLNSNERQAEQAEWLDRILDHDRTWTVVTFHHPIYSTARDRDNASLREMWKPEFDRHGVDLVLTGHDHAYGRSGLLTGEANVQTGTSARSTTGGTVYVVSVSGPKMYDLERKPRTEFRRAAEDTQLYQIISIDGSTLRYEARTATGDLYDAFTLKKRPGQISEMIEQAPTSPERRRPAKEKVEAAG
jgi:hypothetical protein